MTSEGALPKNWSGRMYYNHQKQHYRNMILHHLPFFPPAQLGQIHDLQSFSPETPIWSAALPAVVGAWLCHCVPVMLTFKIKASCFHTATTPGTLLRCDVTCWLILMANKHVNKAKGIINRCSWDFFCLLLQARSSISQPMKLKQINHSVKTCHQGTS